MPRPARTQRRGLWAGGSTKRTTAASHRSRDGRGTGWRPRIGFLRACRVSSQEPLLPSSRPRRKEKKTHVFTTTPPEVDSHAAPSAPLDATLSSGESSDDDDCGVVYAEDGGRVQHAPPASAPARRENAAGGIVDQVARDTHWITGYPSAAADIFSRSLTQYDKAT